VDGVVVSHCEPWGDLWFGKKIEVPNFSDQFQEEKDRLLRYKKQDHARGEWRTKQLMKHIKKLNLVSGAIIEPSYPSEL